MVKETFQRRHLLQIGGKEYIYVGSYRTKLMATRKAKKLTQQGYMVRIAKTEPFGVLFDVMPKKYDVWKRKA